MGLMSETEVDEAIEACHEDGFCVLYPTLVTVWGRRPLG
jgi:hypothetical protein